jgi:putative hydrolase of the HAD superfamily
LGLGGLLGGVVTSAAVGASKPAPELFRAALAAAGVSAGEALHVGDRLDEDVGGARACGIEPVLLRRDGTPGPDGVVTIASLAELPSLTSGSR